jgi:hypothetical protein
MWACREITHFVEGIDYYCRYKKYRHKFPRVYSKHEKKWNKLLEWDDYRNAHWQALRNLDWDRLTKENEIVL